MKMKNMYGKQVRGIGAALLYSIKQEALRREWRGVKVSDHAQSSARFLSSLSMNKEPMPARKKTRATCPRQQTVCTGTNVLLHYPTSLFRFGGTRHLVCQCLCWEELDKQEKRHD